MSEDKNSQPSFYKQWTMIDEFKEFTNKECETIIKSAMFCVLDSVLDFEAPENVNITKIDMAEIIHRAIIDFDKYQRGVEVHTGERLFAKWREEFLKAQEKFDDGIRISLYTGDGGVFKRTSR